MPKPRLTPAAEQFAALGIPPADFTDAMKKAVAQKWSGLPVDQKISDLEAQRKAVVTADCGTVASIKADMVMSGAVVVTDEAATDELFRLKRNAAVNAWRQRTKLQAAIDAVRLRNAAKNARSRSKKVSA